MRNPALDRLHALLSAKTLEIYFADHGTLLFIVPGQLDILGRTCTYVWKLDTGEYGIIKRPQC